MDGVEAAALADGELETGEALAVDFLCDKSVGAGRAVEIEVGGETTGAIEAILAESSAAFEDEIADIEQLVAAP